MPNEPVPSPCIRNCCLNEEDVCVGCFRSLPEIVGWADADNSTRQTILNNTGSRRVAYHERYKHSSG
ncbi:MAG: DUF1289 domain-containing protein [Methyloglobulus sp.]|nr:DUF1289 domain-containing protein [Methyloglobulus sp.]